MAGMAQEALYHNLFNQPKKKYGDIAEKTYDKILRAEGLLRLQMLLMNMVEQ